MKHLLLCLLACLGAASVLAQEPLYIVNGQPVSKLEIESISPHDIEKLDVLRADEETIARFGPEAGNGVILVTLRYDAPARFSTADSLSFEEYVAGRVKWAENDPTARVVLRYAVETDGSLAVVEELEATDKRLLRRVRKALEELPRWEPASKNGAPVRSEGVLRLQLPAGRKMPRERYIVIR